jgi:hypothetical protein
VRYWLYFCQRHCNCSSKSKCYHTKRRKLRKEGCPVIGRRESRMWFTPPISFSLLTWHSLNIMLKWHKMGGFNHTLVSLLPTTGQPSVRIFQSSFNCNCRSNNLWTLVVLWCFGPTSDDSASQRHQGEISPSFCSSDLRHVCCALVVLWYPHRFVIYPYNLFIMIFCRWHLCDVCGPHYFGGRPRERERAMPMCRDYFLISLIISTSLLTSNTSWSHVCTTTMIQH